MRSLGPRLGLATLTFSALLTTTAYAQTARMTGTVIDPTNAAVPGATVTIVNVESNDKRVAVSNERGQYNVPFCSSRASLPACSNRPPAITRPKAAHSWPTAHVRS
jgi:hypothetical protein